MFKLFKPFKPPPLSSPRDAGEDEGGDLCWCFVANDLDVVTIGVEDESAIVI
jgi:hypothetical protein